MVRTDTFKLWSDFSIFGVFFGERTDDKYICESSLRVVSRGRPLLGLASVVPNFFALILMSDIVCFAIP
jgi:hypothetical protein